MTTGNCGDACANSLLENVAALLSPARLTTLTGVPITWAREEPLGTQESAYSGSHISAVQTDAGRFILKRVSRAWDYFMRVTDDRDGREARIWTRGLLNRLPPELGHPYLACARDGDNAWAILMRDVSASLLPRGPIALADHHLLLEALAAFHAAFWEYDAGTGFTTPHDHYHVIAPVAVVRDAEFSGERGIMHEIVPDGWQRLVDLLDPAIGSVALALTNDPSPLVAALDRYPRTLVHADARTANLGIERGVLGGRDRPLLIDWALAGVDTPLLDVIWYIAGAAARLPMSCEDSIAYYRQSLRERLGMRFDDSWWEPMLDLSLLGGLIRYGWIAARATRSRDPAIREQAIADLRWWEAAGRRGLARL